MANRNFQRKQALDREVKDLFLEVSFGSSGAPTIVSGLGITSIARSAQGDYLITLADKYQGGLKFVQGIIENTSGEDLHFQVKSEAIASAGTISLFTVAVATATDPASGSKAYIHFVLKNSTVI